MYFWSIRVNLSQFLTLLIHTSISILTVNFRYSKQLGEYRRKIENLKDFWFYFLSGIILKWFRGAISKLLILYIIPIIHDVSGGGASSNFVINCSHLIWSWISSTASPIIILVQIVLLFVMKYCWNARNNGKLRK